MTNTQNEIIAARNGILQFCNDKGLRFAEVIDAEESRARSLTLDEYRFARRDGASFALPRRVRRDVWAFFAAVHKDTIRRNG